ncbi:hypothetical protein FNF28_04878 [Cafeteria roenbergensis]|uniref:Uncharacterized protein n=1 Tax=Cafeteria roenbergensis TaxID=33653 RepID=A0A5A8DBS7_CAFRO|nr:hypothetical protein FNF28_04878 [Cafeteria roenbergensis]
MTPGSDSGAPGPRRRHGSQIRRLPSLQEDADGADVEAHAPGGGERLDDWRGLELLIRQIDAEVSFKPQVFVQELVFNVFGLLSLPLMVALVSWRGVFHRWFLCTCQRPEGVAEDEVFTAAPLFPWWPCCCRTRAGNAAAFQQGGHLVLVLAMNSLFAYFVCTGLAVGITNVEVVLANVLVLLRAATVASKYSFFSVAEYTQTIKAPVEAWSDQRKLEKLVLGGWLSPSSQLLYTELERAAVRNSPELDTLTVTFPSDGARLAALERLKESIPAFLRNESAVLHPRCVAFLRAVVAGECVEEILHEDARRATRLCSQREQAEKAAPSPGDPHSGGQSQATAEAEGGVLAMSRGDNDTLMSAASADSAWEDSSDETPILYDTMGMATLPAKLFAWHVARKSHREASTLGALAPAATCIIGLVFALSPFVTRAVLSGSFAKSVLGMSVLETSLTLLVMFISFTNLRITVSFCALGILDLVRRFDAQVMLHRLLDVRSPLTLQMHDATVRSAGGTFLHAMGLVASQDGGALESSISPAAATWLSPAEAHTQVERRVDHLRLPAFYPSNLIAWMHLRNTIADLGRSYGMRIQLYTAFFAILVAAIVVAQVIIFFDMTASRRDSLVILTIGTFAEVVFGAVLTSQIVVAARTNRSIVFQQRRFNRLEALTQDMLCDFPEPLSDATVARLKKCRKVLSLLSKSVESEFSLNPVRVLFVRADFALVASVASVAASGLLAAMSALRGFNVGEGQH